jgi:hypothetical protein
VLTSSVISVISPTCVPVSCPAWILSFSYGFQVAILSLLILSAAIYLCLAFHSPMQHSGQDGADEECLSARGRRRRGPSSPLQAGQGQDSVPRAAGRPKEVAVASCRFPQTRLPIEFVASHLGLALLLPPPPLPQLLLHLPSLQSHPPLPPYPQPPPLQLPLFHLSLPFPLRPFHRLASGSETRLRCDPLLLILDCLPSRAIAAWVRQFRHVPMESWLPAQRHPAAAALFSTRTQESFLRAQLLAHITLRAHRLLDLPAFLLATGANSEVHLSYLPGLLSLLTVSGRYIEEWVRVFYAIVWIDSDHQWMRFRFEREDVTLHAIQICQLFGFPESSTRLHSLCYDTSDPPCRPHGGVASAIAHVVALFRPPFIEGLRRSLADFTPAAKYLYELMRRTLLPRMGYRKATTHIRLWLLGALISHSEFDVVDFLICEIENTVLDGLRARRQLPYAHYLCHIFA